MSILKFAVCCVQIPRPGHKINIHLFECFNQVLVEMTDGGLDFTFECIGNVKTMVRSLE